MSFSRFSSIENVQNRSEFESIDVTSIDSSIVDFFGCNVFNDAAMNKYLPEQAYLSVKAAIQSGNNLTEEVANIVAKAMKQWATDKKATHYAHWFQPLTGRTAEKHDSFFTLTPDGKSIEEFSGKELAQQEPDGSSFPGGGLRTTFEARGYTAWDPSSPAFILEQAEGKTLCIPTIFVTYGGEAMDFKLPLLKSIHFLENEALAVCHFFDKSISKVTTTLGWEQEYFLIDQAFYRARPDLMLTGRTLIGRSATKGQQLEDHYFGSIPERVFSYMRDLETECHKLGIPVRTRHNEVAPCQYELAPMFEEVNIATDHNSLLMDVMERVATRHKFAVLLHEKPFEGVNGSGKHNNWSLGTNNGQNLLSPGSNPSKNLQFLTFFVNTIRAVKEYADLLRASVASASNDHRLGANEAPPAIISVYVGAALTKVLNFIAEGKLIEKEDVKEVLNLLSKLPSLKLDNTDRNRTSPFAFTGNKFEIRMVGSSMNCAAPMTIMNTIVGAQLNEFKKLVSEQMNKGKDQDTSILHVLKKYINESKSILFEGDGYSDEWQKEAHRRGLGNTPNTPDALKIYKDPKTKKLFETSGVLSSIELDAHYHVMFENYNLKINIESKTLLEICKSHIVPAAINYQTKISTNILQLKSLGINKDDYKSQTNLLVLISKNIESLADNIIKLETQILKAQHKSSVDQIANVYCTKVLSIMQSIRLICDELEGIIEDDLWPMVKYREMLFFK